MVSFLVFWFFTRILEMNICEKEDFLNTEELELTIVCNFYLEWISKIIFYL
jgi:hypothetical protein